jgi:Holliday junction resolvase
MAGKPTPAGAYRRGRAFEWHVRDVLEQAGWWVIRSAGSHSPADLVAWAPAAEYHACWLVQAKRSGHLSRAEREALLQWADRAGAFAVAVRPALLGRRLDWRVWDETKGRWQAVDGPQERGTP